jgi:tRNA modification GTPase
MNDAAPICAIATAPGRAGIGVVRVSGPALQTVISSVCGRELVPRYATYLVFLASDGSAIDRGLALYFPAPHSYTGEDVLELQGHGGPVVMQLLLRRVLEAGAEIGLRLAQPGEFTRRAFLNDKLDLAQAEAVADLIDASTEQAARSASRSLAGAFSSAIHAMVDELIDLRMLVEATLDFPEEEIDFLEKADALGRLRKVRAALASVLERATAGALLREGMHVVLAGRPNVGKSSLLNALAGAEVAIVTPIAGTTRDKVVQTIQVEGVPLHIVDTAGLRDATDEVERIGIERSWREIEKADVVLHLVAADEAGQAGAIMGLSDSLDAEILARLPAGVPVMRVVNKIDLTGQSAGAQGTREVRLSAHTGQGISDLRVTLLALAGWQASSESAIIARERHLLALREAGAHLDAAQLRAQEAAQQLDLFAEELRLAQQALNTITGEFGADDLLGVIFSRFCIGK